MNTYFHPLRSNMSVSIFREKECNRDHEVYNCPPDKWAADNGATHTLYIGKRDLHCCGTRPAKLLKTVLYVGVDEDNNGGIKWEKWHGVVKMSWDNYKPYGLSEEQMKKWPAL
jgi:hypothetical protein